MTGMDDLVTWLRAQLDDDERAIRVWASACVHIDACDETGGYLDRFDELRMLAEVEAKRALLEEAIRPYLGAETTSGRVALVALRLLAQPYAGRDGWRPEWTA